MLMLANGEAYSTIEAAVPCYRDYIHRWRRRFLVECLGGLRLRYRTQPPTIRTPAAGHFQFPRRPGTPDSLLSPPPQPRTETDPLNVLRPAA